MRLQQLVGEALDVDELYESVDCTELPHCSLAQAASHERHWLNGHLGRGGNNGGWFYGEQLLVSVTASGVVTGWLVGQAHIDDRWLLEAFVSTRQSYMRVVGPEVVGKKRYRTIHVARPESFGPAITAGLATGLPYLADQGFKRWLSSHRQIQQITFLKNQIEKRPVVVKS